MNHYFENIAVKNLICSVNVCAPDWGEENIVYAYNKFYYFLEGEGLLIVNDDLFVPQPEELYPIPAYTPHTYCQNSKKPFRKYWSHFDLVFPHGLQLAYHKETAKCTIPRHLIAPAFDQLIATDMSTNPLDILTEKAALLVILKLFLERTDIHKLFPADEDDFTNRMNDYIRRNIRSEINLNALADLVHLHPNYFIKYFKKRFSVTPIEYVNAIRLQIAAHLLTDDSGLSIEGIAHEAGFNDYRYFSRLFKKMYGVSPSQYSKTKLLDPTDLLPDAGTPRERGKSARREPKPKTGKEIS